MSAEQPRTILVLDDQIGVAGSLQQKGFLRNCERLPYSFIFETCAVESGYDVQPALEAIEREQEIDLVLLDLKFGPDETLLGFEILRRLTARFPSLPVLVMSSVERDVQMLGRCLEDGAIGFVTKHRSADYLRGAIESAIELMQSHVLLGQSGPLKELRRQAARLSPYAEIPVLVVGERGTGKERVARYIHQSGPRGQGAFIAVNCAGVPDTLFEAEFFGAERGAYTGSNARRVGYVERAHGGTLFLDEVGTLPLAMQAKLLRVLQERTFQRLGSSGDEIRSSFQLLSATNADPQQLVASGRLREDFFDRIAAVTVHTPPLRSCKADIPMLAAHFLQRLVGSKKRFAPTTMDVLRHYAWPGNVRELQRVVQEAVVRSEDSAIIGLEHLPEQVGVLEGTPKEGRMTGSGQTVSQSSDWARKRILTELTIAVEARKTIQAYKGTQWKAEFMRRVYPHCKAQNAKGFDDLIRRLTKGPWGDPGASEDQELGSLLRELQS
jgi:DNA-binding NtrC family response regulator